jgi:hypothetical protein
VALSREAGMKGVSVDAALCYVPRQSSLRKEYRRKVRTMTRGLKTVWYKRGLLNPLRYGAYSWMVVSHKLCRWLVPVALFVGTAAVLALATEDARAIPFAALAGLATLLAVAGWAWPEGADVPKVLSIPAYLLIANLAALNGWLNVFRGVGSAAWSPTRREMVAVTDEVQGSADR